MAGDWIKMRSNLWDDPRVGRLVDMTDTSEATVVGGLYWLWSTADQHTEDGIMPGLSLRQIDRKTGIQGFGQALCDIGWLADHPEGVRIQKFEEHNGQSAKRRASDAQRKAGVRSMSASDADKSKTDDGQNAPGCGAREREEKDNEHNNPNGLLALNGVEPPAAASCPHQEIIALYHQHLPMGTQVRVWNGTRAKHLQARWREDRNRQSLGWWERFFKYIAESEFLTGQTQPAPGRDPFVVSLDWLVSPQNFAKAVEGKYHRSAA